MKFILKNHWAFLKNYCCLFEKLAERFLENYSQFFENEVGNPVVATPRNDLYFLVTYEFEI
jgi:hypothetical protein